MNLFLLRPDEFYIDINIIVNAKNNPIYEYVIFINTLYVMLFLSLSVNATTIEVVSKIWSCQ